MEERRSTLRCGDVSAVVCTKNSIASIQSCLESLLECNVLEIVVVDASSTDGTREVVAEMPVLLCTDGGHGLGAARNLGISRASGSLILNIGSDNVIDMANLKIMIASLEQSGAAGVGAQTALSGRSYVARSLNSWWRTRFRPGPSPVIGTPSLMRREDLMKSPFSTNRAYSDDEELCSRWSRQFNAHFLISEAKVEEIGKANWREVMTRSAMYGASDFEVYRSGCQSGWNTTRKLKSLLHPARVDFAEPFARLGLREAPLRAPFLLFFALNRYLGWVRAWRRGSSLLSH